MVGKFSSIPVACGMLGFALVLLLTSEHGAGITHDSIYYMSLAKNLAAGNGFVEFDSSGRASTLWPPLFPVLLAAAESIGWETPGSARWINAIAFGLIAYLGSLILIQPRVPVSRPAAVAGSLAIVLFKPGSYVSAHVLTEPLFILFTLLSLVNVERFLTRGRWRSVLLAAAFAALASLTRYVGVTTIAAGLLLILADFRLAQPEGANRRRLTAAAQAATYVFIAAAPLALWLFRNLLVSRTPAGERLPAERSVIENIQLVLEGLGGWVLPTRTQLQALPENIILPVQTLVDSAGAYDAMVAAVGALLLLPATGTVVCRGLHVQWSLKDAIGNPLAPHAAFMFVYLTFMTVSASVVAFGPISANNGRLLAPVYVALVLMSVVALEALWKGRGLRAGLGRSLVRIFAGGFCPVLLASVLGWNILLVDRARSRGLGYPLPARGGELARFLRTNSLSCEFYGNEPHMVWFLGGDPLGKMYQFRLSDVDRLVAESHTRSSEVCIVWTKGSNGSNPEYEKGRRFLDRLSERGKLGMEVDGSFGVVFRVVSVRQKTATSLFTGSGRNPT